MPCDEAPSTIRLELDSDPVAVREALRILFDGRPLSRLPDDARCRAEIALAEALNNVVEHAYDRAPGRISVTVLLSGGMLTCTIVDRGNPMPDGALPHGHLPEIVPGGDLPEGGFGWHLIRALSHDLAYARVEGRNELSFRLDAEQFLAMSTTVSKGEKTPH
jgi:serine/threonine-protein kinase RsbW